MNPKTLFVVLLGLVALGYYAYDPELTHLNKLVQGDSAKSSSARTNKSGKSAKTKKKKAKAEPAPAATPAVAETPAEPAAPAESAAEPAPAAVAETAPAAEDKPKLAPAGSARVADALASLSLVNEVKPNAEARYFIYLMSAGWCGPCNAEMPHIVKAYEEIKAMGVAELVLIDFDDSPDGARAYMNKYGATFPAIMQNQAPALPGIQPPGGIPSALIVDERGNLVARGHGSIVQSWKKSITEYEEKNGLPSSLANIPAETAEVSDEAAEDSKAKKKKEKAAPRNAVARSLAKVKWTNSKPSRKAKYYIYLQSASWCGPCQAEMPHIAEEYKAMKKDGRVELLLISFDQTEEAAMKFLSAHKAGFPMVLKDAKGVDGLAGFSLARGIPEAIIVDASGSVITKGHGSIVKEWRKHTVESAAE